MDDCSSIDLAALLGELSERDPATALPSRLSDAALQVVARDLQRAESLSSAGLEADDQIQRPMCVLLRLLEWRMDVSGRTTALLLTDDGIDRCLSGLQFAVERELVARDRGLRIVAHDNELITAIDRELSACEPVEPPPAWSAA